jgi:hypothetical protein
MTLFTEAMIEDDDERPGIHGNDISNAIQCWSIMQNRETSVAEAAVAFNTTPEIVRRAIEDHYWMFPEWPDTETDPAKQIFGHDGE